MVSVLGNWLAHPVRDGVAVVFLGLSLGAGKARTCTGAIVQVAAANLLLVSGAGSSGSRLTV
jgi:hypothetical protein